jgi:hypothetical protein
MKKYDFVKEEILDLIKKLKKQDYIAARYLENNIQFI